MMDVSHFFYSPRNGMREMEREYVFTPMGKGSASIFLMICFTAQAKAQSVTLVDLSPTPSPVTEGSCSGFGWERVNFLHST